jgi:hypothetical protein
LLTPEKGSSVHASRELQIATDFPYGFYGFGARYIAGKEDVEIIEEGLLEAGIEICYFLRRRFTAFDLFIAGVIAYIDNYIKLWRTQRWI